MKNLYLAKLHRTVDEVLALSNQKGQSLKSLAGGAGVSPSTLYRLDNWQTRYPRYETVLRLAHAVGMTLNVSPPAATNGRRRKVE